MSKAVLSRRSSTIVAVAVGAAVIAPLMFFGCPADAAADTPIPREHVRVEAERVLR